MEQERVVGGWFTVSLRLRYDFSAAMESDSLSDTLDYGAVAEVVKREMQTPSNLLEHVADRINRALFASFPGIEEIHLRLTKEAPPLCAPSSGASKETIETIETIE